MFHVALDRRFPELAAIPFASRNNLPDWDERATTDPALARALRELCERPGWLDIIGAKSQVVDALEALEAEARVSTARGAGPVGPSSPSTRRRLSRVARERARGTLPGNLVREWTMERRAVGSRTIFNRLSRLAMVHALIGLGQTRHVQRRQLEAE